MDSSQEKSGILCKFAHRDRTIRLVKLEPVETISRLYMHMSRNIPHSYLRTHRKKSGLTQRELAAILGCLTEGQISRHERGLSVPSLPVAIAYEILFGAPASQIFSGIRATVTRAIEAKLCDMEEALQVKSAKGRDANAIAQKLEWLCERQNPTKI